MNRSLVVALGCVIGLGMSSCATESCACPPEGMKDSDTAFVVVNFRTDPAVENARVELFLREGKGE
jgi:hypothetical protein